MSPQDLLFWVEQIPQIRQMPEMPELYARQLKINYPGNRFSYQTKCDRIQLNRESGKLKTINLLINSAFLTKLILEAFYSVFYLPQIHLLKLLVFAIMTLSHNRKPLLGSFWFDIKQQKEYLIVSWQYSLDLPDDSLFELEDTSYNSIFVLKSKLLNSKHQSNFRYQKLD